MTIRELSKKVTIAVRGPLSWEFKIVLGLAAILLTANLTYSTYVIGFQNGQALESSRIYTLSGDDHFLIRLRLSITIGLFVCAAGLALRKFSGFIASMLGILWLFWIYAWWQRESVAFLRNLEVADYSKLSDLPHAAGLRGATWWDLLVLVIVAILFIWQAIALIRVVKLSDDRFGPEGFGHRS